MKTTILQQSRGLAVLACAIGVQLVCPWPDNQALAMSIRRAPFHQSDIAPIPLQSPSWRTLAGYPGAPGTNDGPGISARFSRLSGIAAGADGSIYVADSDSHVIRKIDREGIVSTVAGRPGQDGWRDGPATDALFRAPKALAIDAGNNLYVGDGFCIRKLSADGQVTTIAGDPHSAGYRDAVGTNALFGSAEIGGLALDINGNVYVADCYLIRKVSPVGFVSTVAGQHLVNGYRDGIGTNALFGSAAGLAFDSHGILFVADRGNSVIRKIDASGLVTTWAGQPGKAGYRDGQGTNAWFAEPAGLALDREGNVYVTESTDSRWGMGNRCIRRISPAGVVSTIGGDAWQRGRHRDGADYDVPHRDGLGPFATFCSPCAIAVNGRGDFVVADNGYAATVRYGSFQPDPQPKILSRPRSQTVMEGATVSLSVAAQSVRRLAYQWLVNGAVLTGATNNSLTLENVTIGNVHAADGWEYRVAVSDGVGYVLSLPASLQVRRAPSSGFSAWDHWQPVASEALQAIRGLAYGNGCYVAIGDGSGADYLELADWGGLLATSSDGARWVTQLPITRERLNGIAFGNGLFVAVGEDGAVFTSTDAQTWEAQELAGEAAPNLSGIAFDHGLFVAASSDANGSIWTSPDGRNWTNRWVDYGASFLAVSAAGGRFVAVGNTILVSTHGTNWEPARVPSSYLGQEFSLESIGYANGIFLAAEEFSESQASSGRLAASINGVDWWSLTSSNQFAFGRVTGAHSRFLAVDAHSGGISTSTNGTNWTAPEIIATDKETWCQLPSLCVADGRCQLPRLCVADGLFVATIGRPAAVFTTVYGQSTSSTVYGRPGALLTSADGQSWALHRKERDRSLVPVTTIKAGARYFGVTDHFETVTSTNGSDWDVLPTPCPISALAYGQGTLVGVHERCIVSSNDDGATWTDRTPPTNSSRGITFGGVVYGNGVFIARRSDGWGRQDILSTSNLVYWARTDLPSGNLVSVSDIAYGGGRFVAILRHFQNEIWRGASILTSTNGFHWQTAAEFPTDFLYRVAYGNGRFVIRAGEGTVITSSDGVNWIQHAVPGMEWAGAPVFGNGLFVIFDGYSRLWISSDGVAWTECGAPEGTGWSVTAGEGVFFAYQFPILYRSGPVERLGNPRWVPNSGLEWTVTGAPRIDYRIEYSEDLLNWQTLSRVKNAPAGHPFIDPAGAVRPSRFYRVVTE
jgi:sugar lactone lactonase YvrE